MDSKQMVDALLEVDPGFEQLCKTLFGDLVEPADVWDFMYEQDGISRRAPVVKAMPDASALHVPGRLVKTVRARKAGFYAGRAAAAGTLVGGGYVAGKKMANKEPKGKFVRFDEGGAHIVKADDVMEVTWEGTFSKTDEEKRQAFGWASVVEIDGKPVIDRQGDWITPEEIEKAAYEYVLHNRRGGNQHKRVADIDGDRPLHASDLIESFVVTPEKIEKMGLPSNTPCGWWVGYKFHDDTAWDEVKKGIRTGFSIHGKGRRRDVSD